MEGGHWRNENINNYPRQGRYNNFRNSSHFGHNNRDPPFENNPNEQYGPNLGRANSSNRPRYRGGQAGPNRNFREQQRTPYDRPQFGRFNQSRDRRRQEWRKEEEVDLSVPLSPEELKIENLVCAVKSQQGIAGQLVLIQTDIDNPMVIVQNAVNVVNNALLKVTMNEVTNMYELTINDEKLAETNYVVGNKHFAKVLLCDMVFEELKKKCFYIIKKQHYEEVQTGQKEEKNPEPESSNPMAGSKAHMMMLKMGWGGKGLGVQEQGREKTVAETMTRNITKEGLGSSNVLAEVENILQEFAHSPKVVTLAFCAGFTKEERAQIHNLALKFNLKSKSIGRDADRRITISKKLDKWELVKELLRSGCENDSYQLFVPEEFEALWQTS